MSEDQQLTVAELLARAQKDNPDAGKRRRRRRSLEEGGVSVAELTGSLKRVDARPPEPKHSSVPIDPPEEQAKEKASGAASAPREVEVEKVEVKRPEQSAAADSAAPAESAESSAPSADETAVLPKVGSGVSRPVKVAPEKSAAADSADLKQSATADSADSATPEVTEVADDADDSINPIMLVLLVFFGLILGVLGFLAFQWIWANAATAVAVIAGIVAVVAVIFGVKALRTGNDALTVTMAGIAAAVMAFGPALI
ncbi:hypothetical protein QP866_01605 [Corynebacterium imitans]|uniref:hypothetical protein n=1 Tax=Corynebacterium imitans TaxID=156978 RepID=UPI00254A12FE|nr:hypothetical protein [Corynebacterium imitans]MDK8305609.1 hypothetical protein [Corynebacterium imitans]MDK8636525.1 hypothetical protein [Corynebacterium imitans]MDK8771801.1 hypothetical protein [Corynebacterium imitans]